MAGSQIERAFALLQCLAQAPQGLGVQVLAERLAIPKSAAHRMLVELSRLGYVRQDLRSSHYRLTTQLVALGFQYLAGSGADVVQPVLDRLAESSGELVRLGVIENLRQTWIAKSQGARAGLRYDPDMGRQAPLGYTASGHAWLSSLTVDEACALLAQEPAPDYSALGPNAPRSLEQILEKLAQARAQGYAWVSESASVGMAALAAVIRHPHSQEAIGVLSIAGPSARLSPERIKALAEPLLQAANELSTLSLASELFVLD